MRDHDDHDGAVDRARVEEVDAALRGVLVATVVAIAIAGLLSAPKYGLGYVLANLLPAFVVGIRHLFLDRLLGIRCGVTVLVASAFVAGVAGASFSGGLDSPGAYFGCLVAMFAMIMFPAQRWMFGLGSGVVASVAVLDLILGRSIDVEVLSSSFILSLAVPAGVHRIVALERLHRSKSVVDPLTGCLNRRALDNRSIEVEEQASRMPTHLSVVSFDIDRFKDINDTHGHALGDRVLSHIAYVARKQLRSFESVYRMGGEEFVVLLPDTDRVAAVAVAERMRSAIAVELIEGVAVTASFGVAGSSSPFVVDELIALADERVYSAKRNGRNQVVSGEHVPLA